MLRIINLVKLFGIKIMGGPFKGVNYIAQSVGSVITPKILGTYELELHKIIYNTLKLAPKTIIDVGAGEGYYAVGFAVKLPDTKIIAFEASPKGREYLKYIASINNVLKNIEIHGYCDIIQLQKMVQYSNKGFILMDVEGEELKLLDPIEIPELKNIPILVEIHDFIDKSIGQKIKERFETTHYIEEIWSQQRKIKDIEFLPFRIGCNILRKKAKGYLAEGRAEKMRWFYMLPHDNF